MKVVSLLLVVLVANVEARTQVNTITQVVKLLQGMLENSKEDAANDKESYSAFKCYCDDNTVEKTTTITDSTQEIGLLSNKIEGLQGKNGELSTECAKLNADIAANEAARDTADSMRLKAHAAFVAEETDLTSAIVTLGEAVDVLAAIGGDQTLQSSADHEKLMGGYDTSPAALLKLRSHLSQALLAARSFLTPRERKQVQAFMQGPAFTGTYGAQSGQIVGILTEMKSTFESNLASSKAAETAQKESFDKFMKVKLDEHEKMTHSYDEKQGILGNNDGDLSTKKDQLETSTNAKADAEEFLETLTPMCEGKTKEYEKRNRFRVMEEAALSKAIAILDNDVAHEKFGNVAATSTGATSFLQRSLLRRSRRSSGMAAVSTTVVARQLLSASRARSSTRLARAAALIAGLGAASGRADNPFTTVLTQIEKMVALIEKEAKSDKAQFDWCKTERETNGADLTEKEDQISALETNIDGLSEAINDPVTGLKMQISDTEGKLEANHQAQVGETKARREENGVYQTAIANTASSLEILHEAISVLNKYYEELAKKQEEDDIMIQKRKEEPAPPSTWEGKYEGRSSMGNKVISMLEFVLSESQKEEASLHTDEQHAQHDYEDSMASLKKDEADDQESLATLHASLADKQKEIEAKREDLDLTEVERTNIERYLAKIKPGCDFIDSNFDARESNRAEEKVALENAVTLLKETSAYKAAVANQEQENMGDCKETCLKDEAHVDCKACLSGVSVPGFCAGHEGTAGC